MLTLRTLGGVALTGDDGRDHDGLQRQPKRLALLLRLASPSPGTWHQREYLMGLLWPEFAPGNARTALRNALYVIRQELGGDVLRTRGDEEVSVDPARLWSDAAAFEADVAAGRLAQALEHYRGEYLRGFAPSDAGGFEQWLEDERARLRQLAAQVAGGLSVAEEGAGNLSAAIGHQRRLVDIAPDDEIGVRRLMLLLDRAGDRAGALVAFEALSARLRSTFEAEPAPETARLMTEIRGRTLPGKLPIAPLPAPVPLDVPVDPASAPAAPSRPVTATRKSRPVLLALVGLVMVAALVALLRPRASRATATSSNTVLVLPIVNATGDSSLEYLTTGITQEMTTRLAATSNVTVRAAGRGEWHAPVQDTIARLAPVFGARVAVRMRLARVGDSLEVDGDAIDAASGVTRPLAAVRFAAGDLREVGGRLAASVAGTLFQRAVPAMPSSAPVIDSAAYRLTMLGWHRLLVSVDPAGAMSAFLEATRLDPGAARAWAGLSSVWTSATANGATPFNDGYGRAEAAAQRALVLDSTQGSAWANLGVLRALRSRSVAAGEPYLARAIAVEPGNPEVYMIRASVLHWAGAWDAAREFDRIAERLDPLTAYYVGHEANGELCANRPAAALPLYQRALALDPSSRDALLGIARSQARLGRWNDAIASLRRLARSRKDSALAGALPGASGEAGYWALKHLEGRMLLAQREARALQEYVSPFLLGVAAIGAGELDRGLTLLEQEAREGGRQIYKLACNPELDEVRRLPRYQRLASSAGFLPLK